MEKEVYEKIENLRLKIREINEEIKEDESILWMGLIGSRTKEELEYILNRKEMKDMAKEMKKAVQFICDPSLAISIFDKEDIEWYNRQGDIEYGEERGLRKGIKKGIKEVAKNLLNAQVDIEIIMKSTGLSRKAIEKLMN